MKLQKLLLETSEEAFHFFGGKIVFDSLNKPATLLVSLDTNYVANL